jgi:hypothetical protein
MEDVDIKLTLPRMLSDREKRVVSGGPDSQRLQDFKVENHK